jgi:hypothetical protein
MSYNHVATAGDLVRFGCSLKVECTRCGAARTMNGVEVARVHGNANLTHLAPGLKCSRRKRKEAKLTLLGRVYPD